MISVLYVFPKPNQITTLQHRNDEKTYMGHDCRPIDGAF